MLFLKMNTICKQSIKMILNPFMSCHDFHQGLYTSCNHIWTALICSEDDQKNNWLIGSNHLHVILGTVQDSVCWPLWSRAFLFLQCPFIQPQHFLSVSPLILMNYDFRGVQFCSVEMTACLSDSHLVSAWYRI